MISKSQLTERKRGKGGTLELVKADHTYLPNYTSHGCCDLPREAHTVEVVTVNGKRQKVAI